MLFPIPDPLAWQDEQIPGILKIPGILSRLRRRLYLLTAAPFPVHPAWLEQRRAYDLRLARQSEEDDRAEQQQLSYAGMVAEYETQGEHMADMLPVYLHKLGLSYKRTVQDRKIEGRFYERIDYCSVEEWYFDEHAYYFKIDTNDLPASTSIPDFLEERVSNTLSVNFNSQTTVERDVGGQERPGLWVVTEHQAGRGLIPRFVEYGAMFKALPKTAPPLTFPVGVGANGKTFYADMDQVVTVLVVGSRGAGKSNLINCILGTWLQRLGPGQIRLFLTDLKGGLEFDDYNGLPYLGGDVDLRMRLDPDGPLEEVRLGQQVLTEPYQVIPVLRYMEREMERRQEIMKGKARKLSAFNKRHKDRPLTWWIMVIDELATLMDSNQNKDAKQALGELARKGRAVGIYLILATQIPDKTILHRQVAGNMDCRMVGRLADGASSALSLGDGSWDATRLPFDVPGRMIWRWADKVVIQSPFIPELTIRHIVSAAKNQSAQMVDTEDVAIAQELFNYALEELKGECDYRSLYAHFRGRMGKHKIESVLKKFELHKNGKGLEPTIELGDERYYLLPSKLVTEGRTPRRLVFTSDFSEQDWDKHFAMPHAPGPIENGPTQTAQNSEIQLGGETEPLEIEPEELMEAV